MNNQNLGSLARSGERSSRVPLLVLGLLMFLSPRMAVATTNAIATVINPGFEITGATSTGKARSPCVGADWDDPQTRPATGWILTRYGGTNAAPLPGLSFGLHATDRAHSGGRSLAGYNVGGCTGSVVYVGQANVNVGISGIPGSGVLYRASMWHYTQNRLVVSGEIATADDNSTNGPHFGNFSGGPNNTWVEVAASGQDDGDGLVSIWAGFDTGGAPSGTAAIWLDDVSVTYYAVLLTSAPVAAGVSGYSALINWRTDESSDATVEYGTTAAYGFTANNPGLTTNHYVALNGLTPNTTYHYRVTSRKAGFARFRSGDFTFTTGPATRLGDWLVVIATNMTMQTAACLRVEFSGANGNIYVDPYAVISPLCPVPQVPSNPPVVTNTATINWGVSCVEPMATVVFIARTMNGPLAVVGSEWGDVNCQSIGSAMVVGRHIMTNGVGGPYIRFAIKVEERFHPHAPAFDSWKVKTGPFCWYAELCWAGWWVEYRVWLYAFISPIEEFFELPAVCVLVQDWTMGASKKDHYETGIFTIEPPLPSQPKGPPPNGPPVPPPGGFPPLGRHGLDVRYSEDGGTTWRQGADFTSAFGQMHEALYLARTNSQLITGFQQLFATAAPHFQTAAQALDPLRDEIRNVLQTQSNAALAAIHSDLTVVMSDLQWISYSFQSEPLFLWLPDPFWEAGQALSDVATRLETFGLNRLTNGAASLRSMAAGFQVAGDQVASGLGTSTQMGAFEWGMLMRFHSTLNHVATGMAPHVRVAVNLGAWVWGASTVHDVQVKVLRTDTSELVEEQTVPLSDRGEFDITLMNNLNQPLHIWFKLPTHLSRVVQVTPIDGLRLGPFSLVAGDANGDNCVDSLDVAQVQSQMGQGGADALVVPSSDVNGDGIVDSLDLSIIQANVGQCGEVLPPSRPVLLIARLGSTVQLSWPATFTGFGLQAASSLSSGAIWGAVPGAPATNNGRFVMSVSATGPRRFFRLRNPPP